MKFISNIIMLAVLVFNILSVQPFAFPARQSTLALSSKPTLSPTSTGTPAVIQTALPPTETSTSTETA